MRNLLVRPSTTRPRVGISATRRHRALIRTPDTLLTDEPVASLDPASAMRALELIHRLCREDKIAAVVSLHQVELVRRFAVRLIGLSAGRTVFCGTALSVSHALSTVPSTSRACARLRANEPGAQS